jgi:hypothetical protein
LEYSLHCINSVDDWRKDLDTFNYSLFLSPEWLRSICRQDRKPIYFDFRKGINTVGKFAGLSIGSNVFSRLLYFFSGPAVKDSDTVITGLLVDKIIDYAVHNRYNRVIIRSYDYKMKLTCSNNKLKQLPRTEYSVSLLQSDDQLLSSINKKLARHIRQQAKQGIAFHEDNSDRLPDMLIGLLNETRKKRLLKGYKKYDFFYFPFFDETCLHKLIKEKAIRFFYALHEGEIDCMQVVFTLDTKSYALFIGTNSTGYKLGLSAFIQYFTIFRLKEEGYNYLNLGGIPGDPSSKGLDYFKRSVGALPWEISGGSTNFLLFPYSLLNPLLNLGRMIPNNRIKKLFLRILSQE